MREEDRIKIINEVNLLKEKKKKYLEIKAEYELLSKTREVKKFLELEKKLTDNKDDDKNIDILISEAAYKVIRENNCDHEIWVYLGSYYEVDDYERSYSIKLPSEKDKKFEYNLYGCLDCDKTVRVSDYEEFETTHFVLKRKKYVNIYELKKLYLKYVTSMNLNNAKKKLIRNFGGINNECKF